MLNLAQVKGAVDRAVELGPFNIRVVTLSPGPTRTPMHRENLKDPASKRAVECKGVLGRMNEPEGDAAIRRAKLSAISLWRAALSMSNKHASFFLQDANQISAFHSTTNSPTR